MGADSGVCSGVSAGPDASGGSDGDGVCVPGGAMLGISGSHVGSSGHFGGIHGRSSGWVVVAGGGVVVVVVGGVVGAVVVGSGETSDVVGGVSSNVG